MSYPAAAEQYTHAPARRGYGQVYATNLVNLGR